MAGRNTVTTNAAALDTVTGRAAPTLVPPFNTYVALLTAAPATDPTVAALTEYAATGYARAQVTWTAPTGDPSSSGNSATITIGPLTGANGTTAITHAALVTSSSGTTGVVRTTWTLNASRTPAAGDSVQVAVQGLTITQS